MPSATRCSRSGAWSSSSCCRETGGFGCLCSQGEIHGRFDAHKYSQYEKLGPFEIKDFLAKVASKAAQESSTSYLNAGRGNPNWVATEPREAFFLLGQFAVTESKRVLDLPPGVGGMPKAAGIAGRLEAWLTKHDDMPGAPFLQTNGAVGGEEVRLRPRQVRPRAGGFDHRRPLSGAGPHAGAQRTHRPRVPGVGDVRNPHGRRARSRSTRSRAAPPPCATSSSR